MTGGAVRGNEEEMTDAELVEFAVEQIHVACSEYCTGDCDCREKADAVAGVFDRLQAEVERLKDWEVACLRCGWLGLTSDRVDCECPKCGHQADLAWREDFSGGEQDEGPTL